jgi:hypothetical protein
MTKNKPKRNNNNKKKKKSTKTKNAANQQEQKARPPYANAANTRRSIVPKGAANNSNLVRSSKALHETVCSVTDPFCYKARLAKWPDGQGGGTLAMQIRGRMSHTAMAGAGGNLTQFAGMLPYSYMSAASVAAGTYTMPAAWTAVNAADFIAYCGTYRIVTWGIIIRSTQPATSTSGTVIIRKLTTPVATAGTQVAASMYGAEVTEVPVYAGMETSIIAKPMGNVPRNFVAQNAANPATNNTGWDFIQVETINNTSTAGLVLLDIEYVYNVEITLLSAYQTLHEFIPPSAPAIPLVTTAASAVINKASTIVEGGVKTIGSHVLEKVEDFFSQAGTDLLGMIF